MSAPHPDISQTEVVDFQRLPLSLNSFLNTNCSLFCSHATESHFTQLGILRLFPDLIDTKNIHFPPYLYISECLFHWSYTRNLSKPL